MIPYLVALAVGEIAMAQVPVYPGSTWAEKAPAEVGMDAAKLDAVRAHVGGRGCVVRHGYMVYTWGDASQRGDVASAAKPWYSHFLFRAVEEGKIASKETRKKTGHHTFATHHAELAPGEKHGYDAGAKVRHASMMENITDCQVLIAGGMGWGAYESLKSRNVQTIVTDVENIDEAAKLYLEDKLPNLMERLH